jgi:UDP:flavonoid glycosyltransferase YjiC (YdhE family)
MVANFTSNGVPQVVLPLWLDHYEYATRAEMFGVGIWGTRLSAPDWTAKELGEALLTVVGNSSEGLRILENAKELAKKFEGKPGREKAADVIAELAGLGRD